MAIYIHLVSWLTQPKDGDFPDSYLSLPEVLDSFIVNGE